MSYPHASYAVDLSSARLALVHLRHTMAMRACEAFSPMFNKGLERCGHDLRKLQLGCEPYDWHG